MPICGNNEKGFKKIKRVIKEQAMLTPTISSIIKKIHKEFFVKGREFTASQVEEAIRQSILELINSAPSESWDRAMTEFEAGYLDHCSAVKNWKTQAKK